MRHPTVSQALATQLILGEIELSAIAGKLAVVRSERVNLKAALRKYLEEQAVAALTRQRRNCLLAGIAATQIRGSAHR